MSAVKPLNLSPKPAVTEVTFLLDKSGSMKEVRNGVDQRQLTIEAFNTYLNGLREADAEIMISLLQFDTYDVEKTFLLTPAKHAPPLTAATYDPRGGTPLIDAAIETIRAVERRLDAMVLKPKVVIAIQTDGEENASLRKFPELALLVKQKTAQGWEFIFMGAGIDAYHQGLQMGISHSNTVSYTQDSASTRAAFGATAVNTANFASGMAQSTAYSAAQKLASGDRFDKGGAPVSPKGPTPVPPPPAEQKIPETASAVDRIEL